MHLGFSVGVLDPIFFYIRTVLVTESRVETLIFTCGTVRTTGKSCLTIHHLYAGEIDITERYRLRQSLCPSSDKRKSAKYHIRESR